MVLEINVKEDLDTLINGDTPVVVDFSAPAWCNPCRAFAPHYDMAAGADYGQEVNFVAVDVDKASWAMSDFGVRGVPNVQMFVNGESTTLKVANAPKFIQAVQTVLDNQE